MKRPYKRIATMILACVMIAVSVIGATAAHSERTIYYDTLSSNRCTDNNSKCTTGSSNSGTGLYQILRRLGCPEELFQKFLSQLNGFRWYSNTDCNQNNSCSQQTEQLAPTERVTPSEAPPQTPESPPTTAPTERATEASAQPTTAPPRPATEAPVRPTEAPTQPPTEAPIAATETPIQNPTEKPHESAAPQRPQELNAYEKEVVRLINEIRAQYGLGKLTVNTELSRVARIKSQDMRDKGYFSHTSPTYGSPFEMMKSFGIQYRTAGENIAMGYRNPQSVVDGWMNSPGHRANILNGSFKEIGMGYIESGNYWTQMFIG